MSSLAASASMVVVVGDLEHGWITASVLLLDVLGGQATGVVPVGAPEVAPGVAGAVDLLLAVLPPLVAVLVGHAGEVHP